MAFKKSQSTEIVPVHIPCAHDLCIQPAILRLKLEAGWAKLCRKHYDFHIQRLANEFCIAQGLETTEQKRAYCRERMSQFGRIDPLDHWKKVAATEGLSPYTYECARDALEFLRFRGQAA